MKVRTIVVGAALLVSSPVVAQEEDPGVTDIEVPSIILDDVGEIEEGSDDAEIDLANVVQSAARGVTTVQEAPAIVTVITEDEIKERHVRTITELIDPVPGYLRVGLLHSKFPHITARGQVQASQFLHDGVSMFDPFVNTAAVHQVQPIELFKRVEVITGPGGVLWGANSLLGVVNVITKDAEDVDGVEVGIRGGHGNGNREYLHGYVMAGKEELFSKDSKLLVHGSFKTYKGAGITMPQHMFSAPLPQLNSPVLYGPLTQADPAQSFMFTAFAKLTVGKAQLRVFAPFVERHLPSGFPGIIVRENIPEDNRPGCAWDGTPEDLIVPGDGCADKGRTSRNEEFNDVDRYAVLEYRTRLASGKAGVSAKAYVAQFARDYPQIQVLSPIEGLLEGGLAFTADDTTYRVGGAVDGDIELPAEIRMLYGAEAFHEMAPNQASRTRQGEGLAASFIAPYQLERLPLPCPLERDLSDPDNPSTRLIDGCPLTFAFPSSRTVFSGYLSSQWRPVRKLILDAGVRVSVSPESLGVNGYAATPTLAASAVYNFLPNWHVKANVTQGFRPPVFANMNANGQAVQLAGGDLEVETTDAAQAEVNARLFKGERRVRELNFRADYSYTRLENLIQIAGARYQNAGDRGIHSAEFLGKLYIQGGHRFELGYTWLRIDTADRGRARMLPEHWFNFLGVFNVVDDKVAASVNVRVLGAFEDANRMVEHRILHYCSAAEEEQGLCMEGNVVNTVDASSPYVRSLPSELVFDRIPPTGELSLGLTWSPTEKLAISGEVFNALNGRFYQADLFGDYEPRFEFQPNPLEDIRAYVGAAYTY